MQDQLTSAEKEKQRIRAIADQIKTEQGFVPFGKTDESQARLRLAGERPEAPPSPEPGAEGEKERVRQIAQQLRRTQISAAEIGGLTRGENLENLLHSDAINFLGDLNAESQQVVADFATGVANIGLHAGHALGTVAGFPFGIRPPKVHELRPPELAGHVKSPTAKVLGTLLGGLFLPPLPLPGTGATRLATRLGQAAFHSGVGGAIFGAARGQTGRGALMGAALGVPFQGALETAHLPFALTKAAISKARSLPEIRAMMNRLSDVHASIGDITDSIGLKRFYNTVLGHVPLSGVKKQSQSLLKATQDKADEIHDHLMTAVPESVPKGESPEELEAIRQLEEGEGLPKDEEKLQRIDETQIDKTLINEIKNNYEKQHNTAHQLYQDVNTLAKEDNFQLTDPKKLKRVAREILENEETVTENKMNPLQLAVVERAAKGFQEPGVHESAILDVDGNPIKIKGQVNEKIASFNNAIAVHSAYRERAAEASEVGKMRIAKAFHKMRGALEDSISDEAERIKNPLIMNKWRQAREHFRENVVPNREHQIRNLIFNKGQGVENIHNTLFKTEFENVLGQLKPRVRRLLLAKALGRVTKLNENTGKFGADPESLLNAYQKLTGTLAKSSDLRDRLLSKEDQEHFKDLDAFVKASAEPRLQARPKPTGMRTVSELLHAGAVPAIALGLASGNARAMAKSLLAISGGGRAAAALLASPKYREQILRGRAFEKTPFSLQEILNRIAALFARQRTGGEPR